MYRPPQIRFSEYNSRFSRVKWKNAVCFRYIKHSLENTSSKIIFLPRQHESLNRDEVQFYWNFLSKILDTRIYKIKEKFNHYICVLYPKDLSSIQTLLYLTAFRYIQEFPEIVKELFKYNGKSDEELFFAFQELHTRVEKLLLVTENYLPGHALISHYYGSGTEFVNIQEFKNNLANPKINSVFACWRKSAKS